MSSVESIRNQLFNAIILHDPVPALAAVIELAQLLAAIESRIAALESQAARETSK